MSLRNLKKRAALGFAALSTGFVPASAVSLAILQPGCGIFGSPGPSAVGQGRQYQSGDPTFDQFFAKHVKYTRLGAEDAWDRGRRTGFYNLAFRPLLRFLQLYVLRLGFLDGLAGLQVCMLTAFFNTFVKQARLWEMQHALPQPDDDPSITAAGEPPRAAA